MSVRLVIVETPFAADTPALRARNVAYARAAIADCLARDEAPFASHLLYTQPGVLDDAVPAERSIGIAAGLAWAREADATAVYQDLGLSAGMRLGIQHAEHWARPIEMRSLQAWSSDRTPDFLQDEAKDRLIRDAIDAFAFGVRNALNLQVAIGPRWTPESVDQLRRARGWIDERIAKLEAQP